MQYPIFSLRRPAGRARPVLTIAAIALGLTLASCGDKAVDPTQPPTGGAIGAACATSDECDSQNCLTDPSFPGGYCIADCSADAQSCPSGASCASYATYQWCMDSCAKDDECRSGYICNYGVCRPPCGGDGICQNSDRCVDGRCQAPCTKDADCSPNRCQDGECLPPCTKDTECLPGQTCDTAKGTCVAGSGKQFGEPCGKPGPGPECATNYCLPTRKVCSILCKGSSDCPSGSWT